MRVSSAARALRPFARSCARARSTLHARTLVGGSPSTLLSDHDREQAVMMEERCIVVDAEDRVLGDASKLECHLNENIFSDRDLLHRAFSVFLFDGDGRLLIQQRASSKITFPLVWANTCCSHPLAVEEEMEERDQLGVKRAAVRKLSQELGIETGGMRAEDFTFLTRVHYKAACDEQWGEHEVDYILFARSPGLEVRPNPNEVAQVQYVGADELRGILRDPDAAGYKLSPWFRLIAENKLFHWWAALDRLQSVAEPERIYRW